MKNEIISIVVLLLSVAIYGQNEYYVPVNNEYNDIIGVDERKANYITKRLFSLKEDAITEYKCECEKYRFLWLRSFHNPVVITITKNKSKITLQWKRTDGQGDYELQKLVEMNSILLLKKQWIRFKEKLNSIDFWNNQSKFDENIIRVLDGSYMVMEGIKNNQYHISEVDIYKISDFIIELTELNIPEEEKY